RRYDERTATMLGDAAQQCLDRWGGDLRRLHREASTAGDRKRDALRKLLMEFKGIGPTGADIFLREVQDVWTDIRPYFDAKVAAGARKVALPTSPERLAGLTEPAQTARMASALVRIALDRVAPDRVATDGLTTNGAKATSPKATSPKATDDRRSRR
ncbi:MAG: hypothetical protein J2P15_18580, partial [Micromonosporaceae bacterium]|nr:hypothetical protein [Micromonosporaceae bacterium]